MLFWVFLTLFGTGTYEIYGSQSRAGEVGGVAMIVGGLVGMVACAWPHVTKWLGPGRKNAQSEPEPAREKEGLSELPLASSLPRVLSYVHIDGDGWFQLSFGSAFLQLVNISNTETANPLTAHNVRARISYRHANGRNVFVVDEAMWRFRAPNGANQFPSRVSINPNTTEKVVLLAQVQSAPNKWFVADLRTGCKEELTAGHWDVTVSFISDNCAPLEGKGGFTILSGDGRLVYDTPALVFEPTQPESGAKAIVKAGPPTTLKQLFEIDWPNLPAFYHECVLSGQALDAGAVKVAWRVNGDFVGRSKFLAILIDPATKAGDAFKACEAIADQYGHFIDSPNSEVDIEGQSPDDTAPTHLKDMVFSKRIFIYYEGFSLAQKGALETIYQSKELAVQFRDAAYAWAHREDRPRATPLVPNSTILPDAKLNPGLTITITKLSPGMENKKEVGAAGVAEANVTFDDAKISIQKIVEDAGRFRLLVPDEKAKFMPALTVEVRNHAVDGNPIASAGDVKAQLKFVLAQGTYEIAPGAWLDEPYSSARLDVGDTRRLILAVGVDWIHDWRMVTNKRTGPCDAVMLDYSRSFPMWAKGTIEASVIGSGRILRRLKVRVQWEHNHSLWMQPIEEGKP